MNRPGVLLVNLGSPDSTAVRDVRRYLRQFLMDGRVLDLPWPTRFFVVHALILPFRPRASAEAYAKIWLPEGSPLIVISRRVQALLQQRVTHPVELAMRYQKPSIRHAVESLKRQGVDDLLLIPQFPHYAMSSFETAVEAVRAEIRRQVPSMRLTVQPPYYDRPDYVDGLVARAENYLAQGYDHLLFSFHGIPERHVKQADPTGAHCLRQPDCCAVANPARATCYRAHCFATVAAFVARTGVTRYSVSFQSRLGREPWLHPYTDHELPQLPARGIRRLLVMCPAFVSDCLETLEEIGLRGRESFLSAGGSTFDLIPCLNEHPFWIQALQNMVEAFTRRSASTGERSTVPGAVPHPP